MAHNPKTQTVLAGARKCYLVEKLHDSSQHDILNAVEEVIRERMAHAWDEARHAEHTAACRFGDTDDCTCENPYLSDYNAADDMPVEPTFESVVAAVKADIDTLAPMLVDLMANLGSKSEWDMDDNFDTTEAIAAAAGRITGFSAGDQSDEDLLFWANVGGYDLYELGLMDEEDEEDEDEEEDEAE